MSAARIIPAALLAAACALPAAPSRAVELNADTLSYFEEPLAVELFGFTLTYNQLVDLPAVHDLRREETELFPRAQLRGAIERQLPNALTVGARYSASYDTREEDGEEFEDRWAVYGGGVWGRLFLGEVNESVREATRRMRGTGNAKLEFDNFLTAPPEDDLAAAYRVRFSAMVLHAAIDENENLDFGVVYERPHGNVDIRLAARAARTEFTALDGVTVFDAHAAALSGQIEYGSLAADVGVGYEHLEADAAEGRRIYLSSGVHYKIRRLTLSAEGHIGDIEGDMETAVALGLRYDVARGLSLNLGYNWADSTAAIDGVAVQDAEVSEVAGSVRYEF